MTLVACPTCRGDGSLVLDDHAFTCDDCQGNGLVSEEEAKDLMAVNVAIVDQAMARLRHEGRI